MLNDINAGFDGDVEFDDDEIEDISNKYLIIELAGEKYGVGIEFVQEIIPMPDTSRLPETGDGSRGVIRLRKDVIPLYDLRKILGLPSVDEEDDELLEMLKLREQDHVNWINELKASVKENREFSLTTDPHQCKFGKWYDKFKTDDINLSLFLSQFDVPHRRIHKAGATVRKILTEKGVETAMAALKETLDTDYKQMMDLFSNAEEYVRNAHRELAIVVSLDGGETLKAVAADKVDEILEIDDEKIDRKNVSNKSRYVRGVANLGDFACVLLDIEAI